MSDDPSVDVEEYRLLSFDPGTTTGFAIFSRRDPNYRWEYAAAGTFHVSAAARVLPGLIPHATEVIWEQIKANPGVKTEGLEVIGMIKMVCDQHEIPYERRRPQHLGGIRRWPIEIDWLPMNPHMKDACHHAIVWARPEHVKGVRFARSRVPYQRGRRE